MATTIFRASLTPLPTPVSTVYIPQGPFPRFARRFENSTFTTTAARGPDCSKFNGFQTCSSNGDYGSCLSSTDAAFCNCNNGIQYLDCVSDAIAASTCVGAVGIGDWDAYERSWFQTSCPTPPSSVMTMLPQPTSVQLDLQTIVTVIPSGPISQAPRPLATPTFHDGGDLLAGECGSPSYTMINDESMVLYAAFVGCNADRPQCCPWNVTTEAAPGNPGSGSLEGNRVAAAPGDFPIPAPGVKDSLERCPRDYYSVSGQCCPNGYYKFTREIASQTPCFSSLGATTTPPPVTLGLAANPTNTAAATSAVVNLALAMGYKVSEPAPALSKGAVVGIGVGSGVAAVVIIAAVAFLIVRWRRKKREQQRTGLADQHGMTYQSGYHAPQDAPLSPKEVKPTYSGGGGGGGGDWDRGYGYSHGYQAPQQQAGVHDGHYRS